jgi:hypothetical protein
MPKPKTLYKETYRAPGLKIKAHCLPTTPHVAPGFVVESAYLLQAGRMSVDGVEREFQDLRVFYREE